MLHHRGETLLAAVLLLVLPLCRCQAPQPQVTLEQGTLVGLKVFPESSRGAVYAFLGVPYAQPPVGLLRFAAPRAHAGWNRTLQATSMKPLCPQPSNTVYDEAPDGTSPRAAATNEDCLYLNIWMPEAALRYGSLPVVVIVSGEDMAYDWPRNRVNGLDLAAEGVVVVSVQYRQNIYGWLSVDSAALPGNYGLQDQALALQWLQRNVQSFGGSPDQLTLLGHGTSGAACALAHWQLLHGSGAAPPFARLVLMSGGDVERTLSSNALVLAASNALVRKLGCHFETRGGPVAGCLRAKSSSDLLHAFESVYENGNGTLRLGPLVSLPLSDLLQTSAEGRQPLPPTLIGIASNEAAFFQDYWLDLARQGYEALRAYLNYTVMPHVLGQVGAHGNAAQVTDTLNWLYFGGEAGDSVSHMLNAMQRLVSEAFHEAPLYRLLEALSPHSDATALTGRVAPLYAYVFDASNAMDMRGKVNLFGGAPHSADLPLVLGPSLYQQISRRRFTAAEEQLCRKLRAPIVNFVKTGNPTPGRIFDGWQPYSRERRFVYSLGNPLPKDAEQVYSSTDFDRNLPEIEQLVADGHLRVAGAGLPRPHRDDYSNPYQLNAAASSTAAGQGIGIEGRRSKDGSGDSNYLATNQLDSGYALHLKRVYGFWRVLLPHMATATDGGDLDDPLSQRVRLLEASADAARYRQGFFAMLGLVAVLLAILGLCVYLLRAPSAPSRSCL